MGTFHGWWRQCVSPKPTFTCDSTRRRRPEEHHHPSHRPENLKSHIVSTISKWSTRGCFLTCHYLWPAFIYQTVVINTEYARKKETENNTNGTQLASSCLSDCKDWYRLIFAPGHWCKRGRCNKTEHELWVGWEAVNLWTPSTLRTAATAIWLYIAIQLSDCETCDNVHLCTTTP